MSVFHRGRGSRKAADCAAIFVHAGAGYHSVANEHVHLQACNDAATAAMALLRNGATAVEAVEMAIKVLEDREITNAGYGSNLAVDGTVEGDAVIVDHLGRSGGVGAVAQIKNPISLARHVLDLSTQELTLRRVPPNLLVSQGATDFGHHQGMPILPFDALVSPAARERWNRWRQDLKNAEKKARHQSGSGTPASSSLPSEPPPDYEDHVRAQMRAEHTKALQASVWNEGQPVSPPPTAAAKQVQPCGLSSGSRASSVDSHGTQYTPATTASDADEAHVQTVEPLTEENLARSTLMRDDAAKQTAARRVVDAQDAAEDSDDLLVEDGHNEDAMSDVDDSDDTPNLANRVKYSPTTWHDGSGSSDADTSSKSGTLKMPSLTPSPPASPVLPQSSPSVSVQEDAADTEESPETQHSSDRNADVPSEDNITDTVGAIAIDSDGNVACAASSGGIGMKYRGRIGPAALVGVGAAVIPVDPEDKSRTCAGAVTSGTGEHMGTTLAANVCAERLYHNLKKRKGGGFEHAEDDQAVRAMIELDFMEHPSVKHSHSAGAIGVLAVKKTTYGAYLYFAHNTDSFAIASMHSDEPKPTCTMSRSHGNGMVAQGGRAIRYKRKW